MGNYAFIDSQNVNLAIQTQGWKIDWKRFRVYLKEKYGVTKAFLFLGYLQGNNVLYTRLQEAGFICIFKPTLVGPDGAVKGNCDAELVLHAMILFQEYEKAIIVSGDGDFYCLIDYFIKVRKLEVLLIPNRYRYSGLLKLKNFKSYTRYMNELKQKIKRAS